MKSGVFFTVIAVIAMPIAPARGEEQDLNSLFDIKTDGTTQKVKVGEQGKFVLAIKTKDGSHVSDEAPLKLELSASGVKLEKKKLTYADSLTRKSAGPRYPDPLFEVPFTAEAAGKNAIDANLTFFLCTESVCARQAKKIHLLIESS
jgi:hypothetical protein